MNYKGVLVRLINRLRPNKTKTACR